MNFRNIFETTECGPWLYKMCEYTDQKIQFYTLLKWQERCKDEDIEKRFSDDTHFPNAKPSSIHL